MDQQLDVSDRDLLQAVEELEELENAGQSGGGRRRRRTRNREGTLPSAVRSSERRQPRVMALSAPCIIYR